MHQVLMGALTSLSFGVADFLASLSSRRIQAKNALTGMLVVSTAILTLMFGVFGSFSDLLNPGIWLACLHGAAMACALLLFFHAMAIGPINVAAPIVAAHPLFIIAFALLQGSHPSIIQTAAMLGTVAGLIMLGAFALKPKATGPGKSIGPSRQAVACAVAASIVYALAIVAAQQAVRFNDELTILWLGRVFGLLVLLMTFVGKGERPSLPIAWWPFFCLHGALDSGGLLFLLLGSGGQFDEITAVVASTFTIVTVALAWVFLGERMSRIQYFAVILILACVMVLASGL